MKDRIKIQEAKVAKAQVRNLHLALEAELLGESLSKARTKCQNSYEEWKTEVLLLQRMKEGQQ